MAENAALNAIKRSLDVEALGTRVDSQWRRSTGSSVVGEAEVTASTVGMSSSSSAQRTIPRSTGTHERVIVALWRLAKRLDAKRVR
jgi:hypothetical protein